MSDEKDYQLLQFGAAAAVNAISQSSDVPAEAHSLAIASLYLQRRIHALVGPDLALHVMRQAGTTVADGSVFADIDAAHQPDAGEEGV